MDFLSKAVENDHLALGRETCARLIREDQTTSSLRSIYAGFMGDLHLYEEAHRLLDEAAKLASDGYSWEVFCHRGRLHLRMGKFGLALDEFLHAHSLDGGLVEPLAGGAEAAFCCGNFEEAVDLATRAIGCGGSDLNVAYYFQGKAFLSQRLYQIALDSFQKTLSIDPDYEIAKSRAIDAHGALQLQTPEFLSRQNRKLISPQQRAIERKALEKAWDDELPATTRELCEALLPVWPKDVFILCVYANSLGQLALCEKAHWEDYLDQAEKIAPSRVLPAVLDKRGHVYEAMGRFDLAVKVYERAHWREPANATHPIFAAIAAWISGDIPLAIQWAMLGCACTKGAVDEAHYILGGLFVAQRKYNEARTCYLKALEMDTDYDLAKGMLTELEAINQLQREYPL